METSSLKVEISAQVTSQGLSLGLLNSVLISQCREIEEFLVDESDDGNITSLGSYPDSSFRAQLSLLRFKDFEPTTVHQQIKTRFNDPVVSRLITDQIVLDSQRKDLPQGPLLITVFLKFTKKEYIVAPFSCSLDDSESRRILCDLSRGDVWRGVGTGPMPTAWMRAYVSWILLDQLVRSTWLLPSLSPIPKPFNQQTQWSFGEVRRRFWVMIRVLQV